MNGFNNNPVPGYPIPGQPAYGQSNNLNALGNVNGSNVAGQNPAVGQHDISVQANAQRLMAGQVRNGQSNVY